MGHLAKLVIAGLLLFCSLASHAAFAPQPSSTYRMDVAGYPVANSSTPMGVCVAFWNNVNNGKTHVIQSAVAGTGGCFVKQYNSDGTQFGGDYKFDILTISGGSSCPVNSTGTTSCVCNSGYVENATQTACEVYIDPAIAACAAVSGSEAGSINSPHVYGTDMQATDSTICESYLGIYNCAVSVNYLMAVEYQGQWTKTGVGRFTGSVCTPGPTSPTPLPSSGDPVNAPTVNPCADGSVLGTVNGVSTCSPPTDLNVVQAVKTTTASAPAGSASAPTSGLGADAPPTAVKVDEQTSCTGGNCTTERKYTDATGVVVGTVVSTDTQAAFCAKNADALICGGDSGSMSDFCKKNPTALACVSPNLGELTDQPLGNENVALSITADSGWGAGVGSCPAPRTVQLSSISLSMPFDLLCDFAQGIRPVVIALAWLAAALGFIGFARRD